MNIYVKLTLWFVLPIGVGIALLMIGLRWQLSILFSLFVFRACYNLSKLLEMCLHDRVAHLLGEETFNRILLWVFNRRRVWFLVSVALTIITITLPLAITNPSFFICREIARVLGFFTALMCQVLPLAISAVGHDEKPKFGDFWINSHYYMSGFSLIVIVLYSFL